MQLRTNNLSANALSAATPKAAVHGAVGTSPGVGTGGLTSLRRPKWLPVNVWPFETLALAFENSGIAVTDIGDGPVLLFVHTGLWSFIWRDGFLRLAPDFRCVCFDAPGTGRSERLPSREISLEKASRAANAVIEALDLRDATLVFHDLGGLTGIAAAARMPERIRGLCAVNAFAWRPSGIGFRGMLGLIGSAPMRELSAWTGFLMRITSSAFGVGRHLDAEGRNAFYQGIGRQGVRAFHSYLRDARKSRTIYPLVEQALAGPLRKLPLCTIFGERNDPLKMQPRWKQMFPDVRQVVVANGNHFPMCDDPDLVASTIRELYRDRVAPTLARRN